MDGFTSRILHRVDKKVDPHGALRFPMYECSAFEFDSAEAIAGAFDGSQPAHAYSRVSNPTIEALESRITDIAGAYGTIALSSGMAAVTTAILTLCEAGTSIVASKYLFGNTISLFEDTLRPWGLTVRWVDPAKCEEVENAIDGTTRLVFVETLSNPQIVVADVRRIAQVCKQSRVPFVLDNSLVTSYLLRSIDAGASLEIVSAAKYISGGGTSIGGLLIDNGTFDWSLSPRMKKNSGKWGKNVFLKTVRSSVARNVGACLSPHSAYLHMLGLETLSLRIDRSSRNAMKVATFLSGHSSVGKVNYPGLPTSCYHELAKSQFRSGMCGGLLSFDVLENLSSKKVLNNLKMIKRSSNFNDNKSLVIHPASTLFCECSDKQLLNIGINQSTIRLSVGIEEVEDIIGDLHQALDAS